MHDQSDEEAHLNGLSQVQTLFETETDLMLPTNCTSIYPLVYSLIFDELRIRELLGVELFPGDVVGDFVFLLG